MIRDAINKIEEMAAPITYQIGDKTFASDDLVEIRPIVDSPSQVSLFSLDGIVKMIVSEAKKLPSPIFIQIKAYNEVRAFSTYGDDRFTRHELCKATPNDIPGFKEGWWSYEQAMIALRSIFEQTDDTEYLLGLLSKITDENSVTTEDNGLSQSVQVRQGIQMVGRETVKSRVKLRPYRTFLEIQQPESEFLVRVKEGGQIGLFEADGGMWKLGAREGIRDYFTKELATMIETGEVVVMI